MSATSDKERTAAALDERRERQIEVLKELLRIVMARREELPVSTIASRIERSRSTVYRREEAAAALVDGVLDRKGQRRRS